MSAVRLTDGGVYDNLGLQPAFRDPAVLVSDGGGQMEFTRLNLPWRRLTRYPELLQQGIGKLRKSWLMRDFSRASSDPSRKIGTYWGIADHEEGRLEIEGADVVQRIADIRTDMNRFTDAEMEILVNHGYLRAARKMLAKAPEMLVGAAPLVTLPYPRWQDRDEVFRALRLSHKRLVPFRSRRSSVG